MFARQVLVQTGQVEKALARASKADDPRLRASLLVQLARRSPGSIDAARALFTPEVLSRISEERLTTLVAAVANHAPSTLEAALAAIPDSDDTLVSVHVATFAIEDPRRQLRVNERVLAMPTPASGAAREEFLKAHNNACVRAHLLKDFARAAALSDAAQPYASDNPYIYHSAACAYAAVGDVDRAFEQVKLAVAADYDHLDRVEVDVDLGTLLDRADFKALFQDLHERRARSEPVVTIDDGSFAKDVLRQEPARPRGFHGQLVPAPAESWHRSSGRSPRSRRDATGSPRSTSTNLLPRRGATASRACPPCWYSWAAKSARGTSG